MSGLPIPALFTDPGLFLGQCCGYDLIFGFASRVALVATPRYAAPGCEGASYRSFVLVRSDCSAGDLGGLRGGICIINDFNSHSGTGGLRALVAPLSRNGRFFSGVRVSGTHVNSLALLLGGAGDVMAMDCVLHALLMRHRPAALDGTRVLCLTEPVPAPPMVTSSETAPELRARLCAALAAALIDRDSRPVADEMLLDGVEHLPLGDYSRLLDFEAEALRHGYRELHATSSAVIESLN